MKRTNIHIPQRILNLLKQEANRLEISRAELIRRILDDHIKRKKIKG